MEIDAAARPKSPVEVSDELRNLGESGIRVSRAKVQAPEIIDDTAAEKEPNPISLGSLVTIINTKTGVEQRIYISGKETRVDALSPQLQVRLQQEGCTLVNPLFHNPNHKRKTLAELLVESKNGKVRLHNGEEARIVTVLSPADLA